MTGGEHRHRAINVALYEAAKSGDLDDLYGALATGADVRAGGDAALWAASENGRAAAVSALLARGADPSAREGRAIRAAAGRGHLEVVEILLAAGAVPDGEAVARARKGGFPDIAAALILAGAPDSEGEGEPDSEGEGE